MTAVGVRELANHAGRIVREVTETGRPQIITNRGRPVAAIIPIDPDALEDFVLAHATGYNADLQTAKDDYHTNRTRPPAEVFDT